MVKPVFVYGTLRVGQSNHHIIESQLVRAVPAVIRGDLYHLPQQGYPAVILDGAGFVYGEIMDFYDFEQALSDMDRLEGYEGPNHSLNLYDRVTISAAAVGPGVKEFPNSDQTGKPSESSEHGLAYSNHDMEVHPQNPIDTLAQECYVYVFSPNRVPWLRANATKVEGGDWVEFIGERHKRREVHEGQVDQEKSQE